MNETAFDDPCSIYVSNSEIFVADRKNLRVRKLLQTGDLTTIAGMGIGGYGTIVVDYSLATEMLLRNPISVFVSHSDEVYISDGSTIRKILRNGRMKRIAGLEGLHEYNGDDQLAVNAMVNLPSGLFVDEKDRIYFCDKNNHRIRMIDQNGMISTIAGTGERGYNGDGQFATGAKLNYPTSLVVYNVVGDMFGIYFCDFGSHRIRKIDRQGIITTIAGTGIGGYNGDNQLATTAMLNHPHSLAIDSKEIFFTDFLNHRIRKILPNGMIETIAGAGLASDSIENETDVNSPKGISIENSQIFFSDGLHRICKVGSEEMILTLAGNGTAEYAGDIEFSIEKYPHKGRRRMHFKPFSNSCHDVIIVTLQ